MPALLPSWLSVIRHVAVNDVNSRYLFYYTSDLQNVLCIVLPQRVGTLLISGSQISIPRHVADVPLLEGFMPVTCRISSMD